MESVIYDQKSFGIRVNLDNFGKGHSSLVYLSQLPLNAVKTDRYFMSKLEEPRVQGILKSIIIMSHEMGIQVIAEGVETQAQMQFLDEIGCEYSQGYFYAEGLDPNDF